LTDTQDTAQPQRKQTKRQMIEEARTVALTGDWEQSLAINTAFLERFPHDAQALNRKGRALLELGRLQEAWDTYSEALSADPANMIARRNLQRLEMLASSDAPEMTSGEPVPFPRGGVFIEEVGKTWVDELTRAADDPVLATVSPGEQLTFEIRGADVAVFSRDGRHLGELEQRIAQRLIDLTEAGITFEMYALGMSGHSLRFIMREVHRDPSLVGRMGLPRQNRLTIELMRERELLSQREEADFTFGDEEDELLDHEADDDEEEDAPEDDEEPEIDEDAASYVDSPLTDDEGDDQM
jgi:tetratricopeptide (TPR) repeat protein